MNAIYLISISIVVLLCLYTDPRFFSRVVIAVLATGCAIDEYINSNKGTALFYILVLFIIILMNIKTSKIPAIARPSYSNIHIPIIILIYILIVYNNPTNEIFPINCIVSMVITFIVYIFGKSILFDFLGVWFVLLFKNEVFQKRAEIEVFLSKPLFQIVPHTQYNIIGIQKYVLFNKQYEKLFKLRGNSCIYRRDICYKKSLLFNTVIVTKIERQ